MSRRDRWLVTGCSTGLGRAIALAALEDGRQVAVTARKPAAVADLVDRFPDRAIALALDVTDRAQVAEAVAAAEAAFGGIDVLVNNAGYGYMAAVEEGEDEVVRAMFDTNYFGVVDVLKAVLPGMRARRDGHVINISSMTGLVANPPNVYYSSSKFALEALTEGLSKELAPLGIKVSAVEPGAFRSDWAARSMQETSRPIADYDAHVGARRRMIRAHANDLVGDPRKLGEAVLMLSGMDEPPPRLLLGKDVLAAARAKFTALLASIDEWEATTTGSDLPLEER